MSYVTGSRAIPIGVLNILTGNIDPYETLRRASKNLGISVSTISSHLQSGTEYNNYKFLIKPYRRIQGE